MSVVDIIDEQDEMHNHSWKFTLWPRQWQSYQGSANYHWQMYKLSETERGSIPNQSGIYTLLVQPEIFGHPACSYLMYVGKTKDLRRRFGNYLNERRRETGRPKILRVLNKYSSHIWFCFTPIPENNITMVEDTLLEAYIPPCNDRLPASIRRAAAAF